MVPSTPDNTKSDKHVLLPKTNRLVSTPCPAGITEPENEKPKTVVSPVETVNPTSAAIPPDALTSVEPFTSNWKPAISTSLL